ncbi:hypothetical protein Tco_0918052, partial [Tanacetum coccineum]
CETRNLISKNKEKDIGKILTIIKKKGKSKARKNNNEYEGDDDQLYSLSQGDSEDLEASLGITLYEKLTRLENVVFNDFDSS